MIPAGRSGGGRLPPQSWSRRGGGREAPSALGGAGCWGEGLEGLCSLREVRYGPACRALTAPGSAGGSEESTLGAAGLLSREQLGPDARGWGPPSRDRGAPWGQGRSAGLSPPSQPGSSQVRGPWRRLRRTAGRVEHNTSGGSVLQGLLPSSRPRAGLSEGPTGKGGGQRVHRSAPRRDTAGERRRPGAGLRRRSWGERARGRREGGRWELGSTEHPHPRPPSSQERALSDPVWSRLGQVICHALGHDPAVSCGGAIAREAQKLQPDSEARRPREPHSQQASSSAEVTGGPQEGPG